MKVLSRSEHLAVKGHMGRTQLRLVLLSGAEGLEWYSLDSGEGISSL